MGKGRLYSKLSFIYKSETLCGLIKGVSGGCFVLIKNDVTHNPPLPTIRLQQFMFYVYSFSRDVVTD